METRTSAEPASDPFRLMSLDGLTDRFVAPLGLPEADPEVHDIAVMLRAALETALQTNGAEVLGDVLRFAQGRLEVRGLSDLGVRELGAALLAAAGPMLTSEQHDLLRHLLDRYFALPGPSAPDDPTRLGPLGSAYLEHLIRGDRKAAIALTRWCVTSGMDASEILVDILEPVQHEVGRRWALGLVSVAQEHFCTAVTEYAMTDLYPGIFTGERSERRLLAMQAPGSLHQVGLRMVTDVLECHGWSTT